MTQQNGKPPAPLSEPLLSGQTLAERVKELQAYAASNRNAARRLRSENDAIAARWGVMTWVMTPTIQRNVLEMDKFNRFADEQEAEARALLEHMQAHGQAPRVAIADRIARLRAEAGPAAPAHPPSGGSERTR